MVVKEDSGTSKAPAKRHVTSRVHAKQHSKQEAEEKIDIAQRPPTLDDEIVVRLICIVSLSTC